MLFLFHRNAFTGHCVASKAWRVPWEPETSNLIQILFPRDHNCLRLLMDHIHVLPSSTSNYGHGIWLEYRKNQSITRPPRHWILINSIKHCSVYLMEVTFSHTNLFILLSLWELFSCKMPIYGCLIIIIDT